jgi:hypothetical protein
VWTGSFTAVLVAGYGMGMALPLTMLYAMDEGWPRQAMTILAIAMAMVGALAIGTSYLGLVIAEKLAMLFGFGFLAAPWIANALVGVTVKK